MLLASVAGTAAILTRRLGAALIPGVFVLWALDGERWRSAPFYLCGIALPAAAGLWQFAAGSLAPNWAALVMKQELSSYLSHGATLAANLVWRPAAILQYLALYMMPFVVLSSLSLPFSLAGRGGRRLLAGLMVAYAAYRLARLFSSDLVRGPRALFSVHAYMVFAACAVLLPAGWWLLRRSRDHERELFRTWDGRSPRSGVLLLVALGACIGGALLYGRRSLGVGLEMPYLVWYFDDLRVILTAPQRRLLTIVTLAGAVQFAAIFALRWSPGGGRARPAHHETLIDVTTLFILFYILIYYAFMDRYLIAFVPYALIVVGRHLGPWLDRLAWPAAVACVAALVPSAFLARGSFEMLEANWEAAESVHARGVPIDRIRCDMNYTFYSGVFDDTMRGLAEEYRRGGKLAGGGRIMATTGAYIDRWKAERDARASYWVVTGPRDVGGGWEEVGRVPYTNNFLERDFVHIYRLRAGPDCPADAQGVASRPAPPPAR